MKKPLLFLLLGLGVAITQLKAQIFVTPTGAGSHSGADWGNAKTLAEAITAANSGDIIFVLKGTYTAASGQPLISATGTKSGVKLYGGFAGFETSLGQRVFGTTAADSTNFVGNGSRVIAHNGQTTPFTSPIEYDGFTIKGGSLTSNTGAGMNNYYANVVVSNCIFTGNANNGGSGGGMYNTQNTVTVKNCKFYGNTCSATGAGLYSTQNTTIITITDCTFSGNIATGNGGGVIISTNSSATVTNCKFENNKTGGYGGGIATYDDNKSTTISITGCEFTGNNSTSGTTGGGGLSNEGTNPTIANCIFSGNTATTNGGGMLNHTSSAPTISGCTFSGNSAANGGGVYNKEDISPIITNSSFLGNSVTGSGAGIYLHSATTAKIINSLFSGNKANNAGGGVYATSAASKTCTPAFINCTIAGNNANNGGGMYSTGSATSGSTNPIVTNCIIYGNKSGIVISTDAFNATATVTYSNVQYNNAGSVTYPEVDYSSGTGNLNTDPKFADATKTYDDAPFTTGDYTLQSTSPVINKGDNSAISGYTTDLTGIANSRIYSDVEAKVDMGAYEYQGVLPVELVSFTGKLQNNQVRLSWTTASEQNNSYFKILRSADGKTFEEIGTVTGNGSTNTSSSYQFADNNPLAGTNYYRLEQVDFDGKTSPSRTISVTANFNKIQLSVSANTDDQAIVANIYAIKAGEGNITITALSGQKVAALSVALQKGYNQIKLPITLQKGVYVATLATDNQKISTKFIK